LDNSKQVFTARPAHDFVIPAKLKVLAAILTAIAFGIIYWSAGELSHQTRIRDLILFTVMAVAVIHLTIRLPKIGTAVLFGETFLMSLAIMHGTAACVAATAFHAFAFVLMMARRLSAKVLLFGFSSMVCGAFVYSSVYQLIRTTNANWISAWFLPAVGMGLTSFFFASALNAIAVWWTTGKGRMREWFNANLPLVSNSLGAAMAATILAMFYDRAPLIMLLAVAPLISVMWVWTQAYKKRLSLAGHPG